MAEKLRLQYAGSVYPGMNRGDRQEATLFWRWIAGQLHMEVVAIWPVGWANEAKPPPDYRAMQVA